MNWQATKGKLTEYFGNDRDLRDISEGDADDWRQWLVNNFSEATVAGHVKRAKQFFRYAVRKRFIAGSPFVDVKVGRQHNDARQVSTAKPSTRSYKLALTPSGD